MRGDGVLWFYDHVGDGGLLESTRTMQKWYDPALGEDRADFIIAVGGASEKAWALESRA